MAASQQEQEAAAAGIEMADADGGGEGEGEPMDTTEPLAHELSTALRAIASLLGLDAAASGGAAELAATVVARVRELLALLPAGFFEPLLPAGSLDDAQVGAPGWRLTAHQRVCTPADPRALPKSRSGCRLLPQRRCPPPLTTHPRPARACRLSMRRCSCCPARPSAGPAGRGGRCAAC